MPRIKGSKGNGKRPEYVALEIMKEGVPVTPTQINDHVGFGNYASKYISFLNRDGFTIEAKRDGRTVVSYTLVSRPDEKTLPKGAFEKAPAVAKEKPAKKVKEKAEKPVKKAKEKPVKKIKLAKPSVEAMTALPAKKQVSAKAAAAKTVKEEPEDKPIFDQGDFNSGNYGVDPDFDSVDLSDLA